MVPLVGREEIHIESVKQPDVTIASNKVAQTHIQFNNGASYGLVSDLSKFSEALIIIREMKVDGAFPANFSFNFMSKTIFGKAFHIITLEMTRLAPIVDLIKMQQTRMTFKQSLIMEGKFNPQAFTKPGEAKGYEPIYVWIPKDATATIVS